MDLARNLKVESVSRLHPTPPRMVRPSQSVAEAVDLMRREQVGCVLVLARLAPEALDTANHVELVLSSGPVPMKQ